MSEINKLEVILNLWYIYDNKGFIFSLRARAYIKSGTDEEKLQYLHEHALTDYLIARTFKLPGWCKTRFESSINKELLPIIHSSDLKVVAPNPLTIFEEAIKQIESDLPFQSKLSIPQEPLVVITPLIGDDNGNIQPHFGRTEPI